MAVQIPLFYAYGELHSYVLSYRSGIPAAATGLSIHEGWLYGIGSGECDGASVGLDTGERGHKRRIVMACATTLCGAVEP